MGDLGGAKPTPAAGDLGGAKPIPCCFAGAPKPIAPDCAGGLGGVPKPMPPLGAWPNPPVLCPENPALTAIVAFPSKLGTSLSRRVIRSLLFLTGSIFL